MFGLQRFSRFGKSGEKNHFLATTQDKQRHLAGVLKEKPLGHVQCPCSKSWLWGTPTPSPLLNCLSMQLCWVVGPSHPGGLPCLPRSRASLAAVPLRAQGRQAASRRGCRTFRPRSSRCCTARRPTPGAMANLAAVQLGSLPALYTPATPSPNCADHQKLSGRSQLRSREIIQCSTPPIITPTSESSSRT